MFLERIVDRFGLDELPAVLKNPQPHVSLIFYSFKFPKGTDIFLFRCQSRVSSVPCARTRPSKTALSADGVLHAGHAMCRMCPPASTTSMPLVEAKLET